MSSSSLSTAVNSSENLTVQSLKDIDEIPTPKSMTDLIMLIKQEMGPYGLNSKSVNVNRIVQLMENYQSNAKDWSQYALFDPFKYTRNLVDDGNDQFNLIVICWGPGHVSPIHDHHNSHCCMKMLQGELIETRFEFPTKTQQQNHTSPASQEKLVQLGDQLVMSRNQVAYINDNLGLHRVSNLASEPAISLHLYTPPIKLCHTYDEASGAARPASQCTYYSKNGYRNQTTSKPAIHHVNSTQVNHSHNHPALWIPIASMDRYVGDVMSAISSPCQ